MATLIPKLLGGVGLFLLGMGLLTEGAKGFAGDSLRAALLRFTGAPWKAFLSGTLATVLLQSSSATTVTVIGFVSAGLLTFPQALGMVFGASLGTTGTGWLVAVFGLKIQIGLHALPVVALGAFLRLMGRGCWKPLGSALAGFGLIFLGIDFLQAGMEGLQGRLPVVSLPTAGVAAHLLGMGAGILMTLVLQSSSAAIAVAMTALHAGTINLEQSASLAVGAAIGTTATALIASIGATNPAKRTAVAFVLFNLATGLLAILLLPALLQVVRWESLHLGLHGNATALAAFHTTFVALGVAVFLPLATPYARWIERLIPDHRPSLTRYLDKSLLQSPAVALEAVRRALRDTSVATFDAIDAVISERQTGTAQEARHLEISQAIGEIQRFLTSIPQDTNPRLAPSRVGLMHVIDHLIRLKGRIKPSPAVCAALDKLPLREGLVLLRTILKSAIEGLQSSPPKGWEHRVCENSKRLAEVRRLGRVAVLDESSGARATPDEILQILDAMRWLDRVGYHAWRICVHLPPASDAPSEPVEPEPHPDD